MNKIYSFILVIIMVFVYTEGTLMFGNTVDNKNILNQLNDDLRLAIYYLPIDFLTRRPLTEKDLENGFYKYQIIVSNSKLRENKETLAQLLETKLVPSVKTTPVNVRIYCKFFNKEGKLYSFGLSGDKNMIVNDGIYKNNRCFYDFVMSFIPNSEIGLYNKNIDSLFLDSFD